MEILQGHKQGRNRKSINKNIKIKPQISTINVLSIRLYSNEPAIVFVLKVPISIIQK